jgi:uncharacterized protein YhaN
VKLLRLKLIAFGPFTSLTLDMDAGNQGLHIIYGPNEAGKSSALRALRQLLYGIEERTTDSFLHSYTSLRVGATVRHSDGVQLEFIRRKARINSLRGPDDIAILDAHALERFLSGVDAETFNTLFGIDHERLVIGGKNIVEGGGQVGEAIFETSLGIVGLRNVRNGLQADCDALFKPGGKKQKINETIQEYHGAQATIKKAQLSSDEWAKHDRDLNAARESRERLEREWQQKSREQNRLARIRTALPAIAQRTKLLAEFESYRDSVLLPDDFYENVRDLFSRRDVADDQGRQAGQTLDQLDGEIAQLVVPQALLDQAEKIEELHRKLGKIEKGMEDRPRLVLQKKYLEHDAREILKKLGQPAELESVEGLRLRADEPIWIQDLGNQYQGLLADCRNTQQNVHDLKGRIEKLQNELAGLPELADPAELRRKVRQAQQHGALEHDLATAQEGLAQAEKQAGVNLARLPHWQGTLEALEVLSLPAAETLDRFEADLAKFDTIIAKLVDRISEDDDDVANKNAEIHQLALQTEVPSESDLNRARQERDAGWRLVREAWENGYTSDNSVADFVARFAPAPNLAEAYERSVVASDQVGDRLRREADRVARNVELISQRDKRAEQMAKLSTQHQDRKTELAQLLQQWDELWKPLRLPPLPPKEMRAWIRQHSDLLRQARGIREQRDHLHRLWETRADLHGQLRACLRTLGEAGADEKETLVLLLDRAQDVVERLEDVNNQRQQRQKEIHEREQELAIADAAVRQAKEALEQWQLQWGKATARLGLPADALPAAANTFLGQITEMFQKLHEVNGFESRIEGVDRDAQDFAANVQTLTRQVASDLEAAPADQAVRELNARLTRARAAQKERQTLDKQRTEERKKIRLASEALAAANRRLDAMCQEARCSTHTELPQVAQCSARRKQFEKEIQQREEQILTHSAGATVEELIGQAQQLDPDALGPEIQKLEEDISALRKQISDRDITIGSEQAELARMDGSAAAAEAAGAAENLLAHLQADVQEYAALRLAAVVLQKGIDRFREKNQGTVLERASRIFARLTVGSFAGLRIDYDDHGDAILVGIRPVSQEIVGVKGMSDGSSDQLYLALRLAALEDWLDMHEPIPFIVDDILLNFDNDRAVAALKALAELSKRTQVIFFTHHEHLVEMAKKHLDKDVLFTHTLAGRPTTNALM